MIMITLATAVAPRRNRIKKCDLHQQVFLCLENMNV